MMHMENIGNLCTRFMRNIIIGITGIYQLNKVDQLVTDSFAIQLLEVSFIILGVLKANLEIVGFPPRCRYINITFGSGDY